MLKVGAVILSVWSGFNLLLAFGILVAMLAFGQNAPAVSILFSASEVQHIDIRALATVNALAVLFNACAVAYCGLLLVIVWSGLMARVRWVFWAVACVAASVQVAGFASDSYLGNANFIANLCSSLALVVGLGMFGVASSHRVPASLSNVA